ncbi:RHS repeat-associated core domain-containing protein [Streptomyces sp. 2131.1]|uniref:RHS repeat-associated core domain-containing protein n=1 Tax=Streptomyces sp. 2131.1 TaxID=1855346 RepID=UPI00210A2B9D|nr:RHS repeat-associated core domain-containing protein [Streptomyces sp. 2131.1]
MTRSGKSYYYLTDATGNILGAVDQAGTRTHTYAYTPTGTTRTPTETVPQPYRYAGAYNDPTGLYEMGARYYDPTLGRFTQPDPSGQETNSYLYATGDPINHTDPSGLFSVWDALGVADDAVTGIQHLADEDTRALWGDVLGVLAGGVAGTLCESVAAASAPATLGSPLSASLGCYAINRLERWIDSVQCFQLAPDCNGFGGGTPEPITTPNRRSTMPNVGWTVEQRATVKRYMLFATILSVVGVVFSIILILIGNTGGWIVLGMIVCTYGAAYMFIRTKAENQP